MNGAGFFCALLVCAPSPAYGSPREIVAQEARAQLGERWAATAVAIAQVESGMRCDAVGPQTRFGRARGVMQVMPRSAESLERGSSRRLHECGVGARVGVKHMAACVASGVRTDAQMAACHLTGTGGWRARGRATTQRYVATVERADVR